MGQTNFSIMWGSQQACYFPNIAHTYLYAWVKTSNLFGKAPFSQVRSGHDGLADQCWVHKQKVIGSSPIKVNVLCPSVRQFTIITPLNPGV